MEYIVHRSGIELPFQLPGSVECTDDAVYHDGDAVAILRLVHKVGGDKDGDALVGSLVNQLPELAARGRVHPTRRLIQKDNLGTVEDGDGEGQLLLPAQRKAFHQCIPFLFQPEAEEQLIRLGGNLRFGDAVDTGKEVWNILHCLPYRRGAVQHLIVSLLYNLKYIHEHTCKSTPSRLSRQEELFRRFIALVNQHSKHERSVNFYADKLCLTPHYLSSVIRETSGQTVMQWINQAVILEAKVLLKHSNLLVFQISDELNFPNPSFFSKFFKRMTGMTPAEYQKQT